ncbi:MAG: EamA family transporter [Hyphomicrobiaceae bacterium]
MEHIWIALTVLAALLQAVRTAAQRDLNQRMSALATTYVRSLMGLPLMVVYLAVVVRLSGEGVPKLGSAFLAYALAGAIAQVMATWLLILMFRLRNFAVGTMLTKSDIVITAILGSALFSEVFTRSGIVALVVVMAGVVMMSLERTGRAFTSGGQSVSLFADRSLPVAFGCAFCFAISYLTFREATLVIGQGSFPWRGAWTVTIAIGMQTVIVGLYLAVTEPKCFTQIRPNLKIASFIGTTSAIGSICWFTAFAMQNASYVRAVGQVEVVFTLLVSALYFRERVSALEYIGIAVTVLGILLFRLGA